MAAAYKHSLNPPHRMDWDFVIARAEVNGLVLTNKDGEVKVDKPSVSGSPILTVGNGVDLIDFDLNMDSQNQMVNVLSKSWDVKLQKMIEEKSQEPSR